MAELCRPSSRGLQLQPALLKVLPPPAYLQGLLGEHQAACTWKRQHGLCLQASFPQQEMGSQVEPQPKEEMAMGGGAA